MSDNLKNDVQNAAPVKKKGTEINEPKFKEPQYLMHCLIESTVTETDRETRPKKNNDKK